MKRGFYTIMCAQFLSSLADNALLIAAIALLASINAPEWMTPLLKLFFVVSYICLAAWVGIFADSMPKGHVMFITNAIKAVGCLLMLFGGHPLLAYAIVGIGAAAYSPAKYGILTELLPPKMLVVANGWIEGLTVVSIILGIVLGGVLIKPEIAAPVLSAFHLNAIGLTSFAQGAIFVITFVYVAAAIVNLAIPDTGVRYPPQKFDPYDSIKGFMQSCNVLWHDPLGQISLSVTSLFWGAGSVLQFLVLKWCDEALGMDLSQGAVMQAVVSVGIAGGAVLAAAKIPLTKSLNVLPLGIVMGVLVCFAAFYNQSMVPAGGIMICGFLLRWSVIIAGIIMVVVGLCAGFFVVPMNALLQHRGHILMSAGRSIAVQNFNENSSILVMLGLYSLLIKAEFSVPVTMFLFGMFVAVAMALVIFKHRRNQKKCDSLHLIGMEKRQYMTEDQKAEENSH
ncbi:MAG: Lysophospholipid transporter LplT [Burkholderia sp.]|jgi:MFS transporter, LPLT family, lysophospholipid transporter